MGGGPSKPSDEVSGQYGANGKKVKSDLQFDFQCYRDFTEENEHKDRDTATKDSSTRTIGLDEADRKICEPCLYDSERRDAFAFCVICIEYLCERCARDHKKNKMTRDHSLLDEHQIPMDYASFKFMKYLMTCKEHSGMQVKYECEQHQQFICSSCLAVGHRKCEEVKEISDETSRNPEEDDAQTKKINSVVDQVISMRKQKEENISRLYEDNEEIKAEQLKLIEALKNHIEKLGEKSLKETEMTFEKEISTLKARVEDCNIAEAAGNAYKDLLDVTLKYGSAVERNIISELILKEITDFKVKLDEEENVSPVRLDFKENKTFKVATKLGVVLVKKNKRENEVLGGSYKARSKIETSSDGI